MANRYAIYELNMDHLTKKLTRIKNKCQKYGCDFTFNEVGEEYRTHEDEEGKEHTLRFVIVEAEGVAVINGWKFIASVEHTDKGNIINKACDIEVPQRYYNSDPICEHCHSNRVRKNTYIVYNEDTNEFKQVGKSCLLDFTNGMSADYAAMIMDGVNELIKGEAVMEGSCHEEYFHTEEYLRYTAETIRHFGYEKRDYYNNKPGTADKVIDYYDADHCSYRMNSKHLDEVREEMREIGFNPNSPKAIEDATNALNWIRSQEENEKTNNYMHNLITVCKGEFVSHHNSGIIASLFPTYNRELEYQAQKKLEESKRLAEIEKGKNSQWIGSIGDRITANIVTCRCVTSWETEFGYTRIYKMTDTDGNVYTWKTSKYLGEKQEVSMKVTGTVKAHNEFRSIKQTELTRCKVA